jgi:mRNA interferase MazF
VIFNSFDIVVVPFPFTDRFASKKRPALVLSNSEVFNQSAGHTLLAMITSSKNQSWPLDTPIIDTIEAGLTSSSIVRLKLFTLDNQIIINKIGRLSKKDRSAVCKVLNKMLQDC